MWSRKSTNGMAIFKTIPKGDLRLVGGNLVFLTDGVSYLAQKIAIRFRRFVGEWFLDRREGIPFYRYVLLKNPNLDVVRSLFRRVLLSTPGVVRVGKFELAWDPMSRRLSFDFEAFAQNGVGIPVDPSLRRGFVITPDN